MPPKSTTSKIPGKAAEKPAGARTSPTKPKLVHGGVASDASVLDGEAGDAAVSKANTGLRLKDLVDRVVAATGGKKKGIKEIVEATLAQMGDALQKGESLNLPAFGKVRVARADTGGVMTLKMRQGTGGGGKGKAAKEPIADAEDQV